MDYVVLGNGVGDQPVDDPYVVTFSRLLKRAFELMSPSTSSVGLPYLVCRPEGYEAACQPPTLPTATDSTYPCRCWRDLLTFASCGVDLLCTSNQRPIRDARHGQSIVPCSLMRMVPLSVIADYQVTPIISITFYMVIIRVGLATRTNRMTNIPLGHISTDDDRGSTQRRRRTQVNVTTLTENKFDYGQHPPTSPTSATSSKSGPTDVKFDGGGGEVSPV